jgi:hypothetical protein
MAIVFSKVGKSGDDAPSQVFKTITGRPRAKGPDVAGERVYVGDVVEHLR